jgi:catechol 2,3-dioxygenase-like lactoylglutathione lyase family enzyme
VEVLTSRTIVRPSDLDRSIAFYREALGLAVAREFGAGDGRGVVFFAGGGLVEVVGGGPRAQVARRPGTGGSGPTTGPPLALWFQVRDIMATMDELSGRGVLAVRAPTLEPWGLIEAWIDDPDGLRIHIVEVPADHPLRRDRRDRAPDGGHS